MNAQVQSQSASSYFLTINGRAVPGRGTLRVLNPATEEVLALAPRADLAQLNEAVAAAKAAFPAWSARSIEERRALLMKIADRLEARAPEFSRLLTLEQGKPLPQAQFEVMGAVSFMRAVAAMNPREEVLHATPTERIVRDRIPLGVVAAITPWNFPVHLLMLKVPAALLTGNTIVVKPAPTTPLTTLRFGDICRELLPPGVLNVIVDDNDLGGALTSHPDVAKVAFTGSTATGRKVMASAAATLKHLTLELGGNDAAIVLDDADPKEVAPRIFMGAMMNAGQICLAIKRVYVPESLYDSLCEELGKLATKAVVGNGLDDNVDVGPLQNEAQFKKVKTYLADARAHGKIVAGGEALPGRGYFVRPTIVRDIDDDAAVVKEEQFGPILPLLKYTSIDDAIKRANNSEYGLGATIWTSNPDRAYAIAKRIESGTVWINRHLDLPPDIPFAGAKQSGLGVEGGQEGLEEFTQGRVINIGL